MQLQGYILDRVYIQMSAFNCDHQLMNQQVIYARYKVLKTVAVKTTEIGDVTPRSLIGICQLSEDRAASIFKCVSLKLYSVPHFSRS